MKIPRNLKPGTTLMDRGGGRWSFTGYDYNASPYSQVLLRRPDGTTCNSVGFDGRCWDDEEIALDIIRIERTASAKPKTVAQRQLAAAKDHLRRKMDGEGKRGNGDKDAAYLMRLSKCLSIMPGDPKRLRAIARRLEGKS